jgi:hypothetical protein
MSGHCRRIISCPFSRAARCRQCTFQQCVSAALAQQQTGLDVRRELLHLPHPCRLMLGQAVPGEARVRRLRSTVPRRRCWKVADVSPEVTRTNAKL